MPFGLSIPVLVIGAVATVAVVAVVVVAVVVVVVGGGGDSAVQPADDSITVIEIINVVETDRPRGPNVIEANFFPGEVGQDLVTGDAVKTDRDSEARVDVVILASLIIIRTKPNTIWRLGQFTVKVGNTDAQGAFCLNEVVVVPEAPPLPVHTHANEEESIYVLEGELNLEVGDRTVKGSPGSFVLVPRGTAHTLSLAGTQSAKVLIIFSPAAIQGLFEEIAGQTDMDTIVATAARYGMELV